MNRVLLQELTNGKELDAIVAVSPENVHYSTGACISTQKTIRDRLAYAVFPAEGEPTFIVCGIEESLVREESWIRDIRTFVEFQQAPTDMLVDVLREKGLAGKKIGKQYRKLLQETGVSTLTGLARKAFFQLF